MLNVIQKKKVDNKIQIETTFCTTLSLDKCEMKLKENFDEKFPKYTELYECLLYIYVD